jgi:dipicolinate synthase subunit B
MSMRKGVYFVPLVQDDIEKKPYSLVCDFSRLSEALAAARRGVQLRPFFLA